MTDYSILSYWENRYSNEHLEIFEWYQTYETLKEKIGDYIKPTDKILNAGCGTSKFAEDLYIDDIKDVTNIDFSENAIKIMVEYYQEQQVEMNYKKMNVCEMNEFKDKTFDVVFDKALLDTILCGENALLVVEKMMKEIYRVLKDEGYYIIISNASEDGRKLMFDTNLWEYSVMEIEKPSKVLVIEDKDPKNFHYIYVLKKKIIEPPKEEQAPAEKTGINIEQLKNNLKKLQTEYQNMLSDGYIDDDELSILIKIMNELSKNADGLMKPTLTPRERQILNVVIDSIDEEKKKMIQMQNKVEEISRGSR